MNQTSIVASTLITLGLAMPSQSLLAQGAPKAAADAKAPAAMPDMAAMGERMKQMQAQMEKMRRTTDPKEREKIRAEHMQSMQETMQGMRGTGGPMMGKAQGGGTAMAPERRMQMMEQRMEMMQMMMEQMMEHQKSMGAPAK